MSLKPKHLWYCFTVIGFVLSFFFNVSLPKDWAATLNFVASLESWWAAHAGNPLLSAFFAGLLFGTVLAPEILRVFRDQMDSSESRPDCDLQDAINYIRTRSRWSIGRIYYRADQDRLLEEDIDEILRDTASQERISIGDVLRKPVWKRSLAGGSR
ncbi:hypothetical protein [Bradyrhizobium sp.]|uniref:hypothetical protein n=1 Tax=Bradyrhizobium sp. TaxID=376 RepID=UPI002D673475|nr:hypothetical protein [Bradyrhizobium sp.]HZR76521.1 hypothetical protein [Bradyrhizobium sp.]